MKDLPVNTFGEIEDIINNPYGGGKNEDIFGLKRTK